MAKDKCPCQGGECKLPDSRSCRKRLAKMGEGATHLLDQQSFEQSWPENIPLNPTQRVGVAQCEDE